MLDFFVNLSYNLGMKRIVLFLGILLFLNSAVVAQESDSPKSVMPNMADEINSSFSNSKDTNWFIHRIKPRGKHKIETKTPKEEVKELPKHDSMELQEVQIKEPEPMKSEPKNTEQKQEIKKVETKQQSVKETVHTTAPAEKVIKNEAKTAEKEQQQKDKEDNERQQYRELQELSNQYQQAVALYTDNSLDVSLDAFAKIPEDKRPAQAWLLMGNILMDKGKKDEAVFMYGRAIMTDSAFYKAYYNMGNIYLEDDKFNLAVEQYKMAGKYNPNSEYVFYNLGCAYLKLGELKKAKSAFIRALELNNQIADFHFNMAYVYKKLGKEKQAKIYLDNYNKLTGETLAMVIIYLGFTLMQVKISKSYNFLMNNLLSSPAVITIFNFLSISIKLIDPE